MEEDFIENYINFIGSAPLNQKHDKTFRKKHTDYIKKYVSSKKNIDEKIWALSEMYNVFYQNFGYKTYIELWIECIQIKFHDKKIDDYNGPYQKEFAFITLTCNNLFENDVLPVNGVFFDQDIAVLRAKITGLFTQQSSCKYHYNFGNDLNKEL